jgi:myo-inositol-1(or 4)-monophosphatase
MQREHIAEVAIQACKKAGDLLLRSQGCTRSAAMKHDQHNIVTEADVASEAALIEHIGAAFPDHSILTEEAGFLQRSPNDLWIIDPLDGTSNYTAGLPWFGILVAYVINGIPDVAAMFLPVTGEVYLAIRGQGSTRNGVKICVAGSMSLREVLWAYGMDNPGEGSYAEEKQQVLLRILQSARNVRVTNCLLDAAYTSDGRFGGMLNWSCKAWDIAAPSLIVEEAGGHYTTLDGADIRFKHPAFCLDRDYAVVAAAPRLHAEVLQIAKDVHAEVWKDRM